MARQGGLGRGLEALFEPAPTRRAWIGPPNDEVLSRLDALAGEIQELRRAVLALSRRPFEAPPRETAAPPLSARLLLAAEGLGRSAGGWARSGVTRTVTMSRKFTAETLAVAAALLRR